MSKHTVAVLVTRVTSTFRGPRAGEIVAVEQLTDEQIEALETDDDVVTYDATAQGVARWIRAQELASKPHVVMSKSAAARYFDGDESVGGNGAKE